MPEKLKSITTTFNWVKNRIIILAYLCLLVGIIILVIWAMYPNQAPVWTGLGQYQHPDGTIDREKTLWDWMNLLIVPFALAIGVFLLNRAETNKEYLIAKERMYENTLQDYLDKMTELLLKEKLRDSENNDEARSIARSRTLTALRILDYSRKGLLLKFIHESGLIRQTPIIILRGADLSGADFKQANLSEASVRSATLTCANFENARLPQTDFSYSNIDNANFSFSSLIGANFYLTKCNNARFFRATLANTNFDSSSMKHTKFQNIYGVNINFQSAQLQNANFKNANLREANLNRANLEYANFENADLTNARLCGANLQHANLKGAILENADLSFANLKMAKISSTQLEESYSLSVTTMVDGRLYQGGNYDSSSYGH